MSEDETTGGACTYVLDSGDTDESQVLGQQRERRTSLFLILIGGNPIGRRPFRHIPVGKTDRSQRLLGVESDGVLDAVLDFGVEGLCGQTLFGGSDDILVGHPENDFTGSLDQ